MKKLLIILLSFMCISSFATDNFVKAENGRFIRDGKPYYYIGTNFWYGAILGSTGQGGNRQRLIKELDAMKKNGIDNLRILVGSDGEEGSPVKVQPTLQKAPNVYNDSILDGLDFLLKEMGKRNMLAVLYLNNSWEWSGGYGYYLEQAGCGPIPLTSRDGYPAFMKYCSQFATNTKAQQLFYEYVRFILGRKNRYTGKKYIDDTAIMSWQIGNEPRAFDKNVLPRFEKWLSETSALIRSLDKNHLISVGSEGAWGCENDISCWERICSDKNIDYCNVHLWPYNWGWAHKETLLEDIDISCKNTEEYINMHLAVCERINKPLVMEEFGYPRDGFSFSPRSSTIARNKYYKYVFSLVGNDKCGLFAGCNFWGWGGFAKPKHENWIPGDDYTGDPAQEQQGLNSVFITDKETLNIVKKEAKRLKK